MSWQEELRRLDAELASGTITRHEHRKQRDELLAAASGGGITSPLAAPLVPTATQPHWQSANPIQPPAERPADPAEHNANPAEQTANPVQPPAEQTANPAEQAANPGGSPTGQGVHPVESPTGQSRQSQPGPPPETPAQAETPAETTTRISADLLTSDRPTSAPSPADEKPTDSMVYPHLSEAPTVITRAVLPTNLPSLTPSVPRHYSGVERQPSAPISAGPRGRGRTWLSLGVGVFVVLSLMAGATWFFSARSTGTNTNAAAPTSPVKPQLDVEGKLPALPGTANPNNSTMPIDKAVQLQIISDADASKIRASGAQEIVYRASSDTVNVNDGYLMLAIPTASANDATKLVQELREGLTGAGFKADPIGPGDAGTAYTGSNAAGRVTALWYSSGALAIGIGVSQPPGGKPASLHTRLVQVRDSVAAALPPS
ncbi:hypothetical protein [Amycolatopsis taiwanensis]|uniref:Flagellar basal body-associated protein FliL n=1 Tax=Amycolatopsis taiwanensis TaxID=342230 RepID=A0A9W6QXZ8_9PSEU|nr:hypothetical protein [Amycolatopsis taiwanensis]GLY64112.1 hypothetical protein Atai01_07310 [Amycolatopsis taiwanensis]